MGRHIIRTFLGVGIVGGIFRHQFIEVSTEIPPHQGISIFVDGEGSGGMLQKNMEDALLELRQKIAVFSDLVCNQVITSWKCLQFYFLLKKFYHDN